ncbi:hypothetical protein [Deinococcus gobiensis]|uniref:Uncharacterized protein n=1 Tax=Deinococcus gobiensis (strain DSM 21396 / JCM 16679 / CGMCC 1.7299 / I-0) TaxID=745776 RepID=H8H1L0_DEIGI|nr:hypothetical protein [Deinococcus gobiensis]AFD27407.1 hypothetical protein DGo_PB0138 [Deinococcus gobiensis I-0]
MTTPPISPESPAAAPRPHGTTLLDELTVHFDYSGDLPGGGGTWGAVFSYGPRTCAFGGLLAPDQASEEGALEETLRLLDLFNIQTVTLFTDSAELFRKRHTTLPTGRQLLTCPRRTPDHVRAHERAQSYRQPYQTLAKWQAQLTAVQPLPVTALPTLPLMPTHRRRAGRLFVALRLSGHTYETSLGSYRKKDRSLVPHLPPQIIQARLRKALLRQGGTGIQPVVDLLTQALWDDFQKHLPTLARQNSVQGAPLYPHLAPLLIVPATHGAVHEHRPALDQA